MMLDDDPYLGAYPDPRELKYVYYKRKYQAFYELCETFARENGRLRKLAYDAHSCIERLCAKYGCDGCPLLHYEMEPCDFASILAEMRELGMEVE